MFKISLIIPVYNEELSVQIFITKILEVLSDITDDFELIFINDGSNDQTLNQILEIQKNIHQVYIINFTRNFGKEAALTAGLDYASGDVVIPIDVDLQDPPELIKEMIKKWRDGFEVVIAKRSRRDKDSFFKRNTAKIFYWLWNKIADMEIPANVGDYRLLDKKVVHALRQIKEKHRFMKGIFAWVGFKSTQIEFERPERYASQSSLNFIKLYKLALDGIFSFTSAPLKIWMYVGLSMSMIAFVAISYLVVRAVFFGIDTPGYTSIMVTVLFMGGINLFSIGIIGQYVARIYDEAKNRPIYLVDKTYGATDKQTE